MDVLLHILDIMIPAGATYHSPDLLSRQMGLEIAGVGAGVPRDSVRAMTRPRTLGCYALVYHVTGQSFFRSAACSRARVDTPTLYVLFPDVPHHYGPGHGKSWKEMWVVFSGALADFFVTRGLLSPAEAVLDVPTVLALEVQGCFEEIHTQLATRGPAFERRAVAALFHLLSLTMGFGRRTAGTGMAGGPIQRAAWHVKTHAAEAISLKALAAKVGMSYALFRKRFRAEVGCGPHTYHLEARVGLARHLLATTDKSVKEIAFASGFSDPYYFSRLFRKLTGRTPSEYRSDMQSWAHPRHSGDQTVRER